MYGMPLEMELGLIQYSSSEKYVQPKQRVLELVASVDAFHPLRMAEQ